MEHAPDHPRTGCSLPDRDRGVTFIELLVSIVLLGTVGIGVLTAIVTTIRSTQIHDQVATAQAQLADAGDVLTDVTYSGGDPHWVACPGTTHAADYTTKLATDWPAQADSFPDVVVTDVQFWNGAAWQGSCATDATAMQRLTLEATVDGHTRTLVVVKRLATLAIGPGGTWDDEMVTPTPNGAFDGVVP